jgi:hypothetical protein
MGQLVEADKAAHDELKTLAKRIIKASIQIEPYIDEPDLVDSRGPYCTLGVKIVCGADEPYEYTWFIHDGERKGPEWEKSKLIWLHLYNYVKDYIGAMLMHDTRQLVWEAKCIGTLDESRHKAVFDNSPTLQRFYKSMGSRRAAAVPHDSEFERWIGDFAFHLYERISGKTKANVGTGPKLRFSPAEMRRLLDVLDEEQSQWQQARDVFWANQDNPGWKEIVKARCPELNKRQAFNDDLLDAIAQRTEKGEFKYRPVQVAVVSAARRASFDNKEKWYSPPSMGQYKRISEAIKEWRKRLNEAKQLNLRW